LKDFVGRGRQIYVCEIRTGDGTTIENGDPSSRYFQLFAEKWENLRKSSIGNGNNIKSTLSKKLIVGVPRCVTPQDKAVDAARHFGEDRSFGK
jgi:hypothetical protein